MSISPLTVTGVSQFSSDLQSIMDRAVKIAQLPIQALQNRDGDALQQKSLLSGLSAAVSGLADSLESLGQTAQNRALSASSSDSSVVTASSSGATSAGVYTINSVTSIASAASERSSISYADSASTPVGTTGAFRLVVGGDNFDFTLANNSLVGLRDKINALGAGVTASILTTGDGNYISISANATGQKALELRDDPTGANTNLLTATNQGSNLVFHLNGIQVTQSRNLVNSVVPGLTFTVQATSNTAVKLTLASDSNALSSALSNFAQGFNALRGQLNAQTGSAAGLLSGNPLVTQLSGQLRQLASHRASSGSIKSLAELGITFDSKGTMSFDPKALNGFTSEQLSDGFAFLDNSSTGLGAFASGLRQFSNPIGGLIKLEQDGLDRVDSAIQKQLRILTDRVTVMQRGLALKLQQADSLLAALESQQSVVKASLQGLSVVLYGKQQG
ncbi:MAG: flagellar filament capping protein FliD [Bryobacteraceae bacterium]